MACLKFTVFYVSFEITSLKYQSVDINHVLTLVAMHHNQMHFNSQYPTRCYITRNPENYLMKVECEIPLSLPLSENPYDVIP
ncbi:unnamed protein product [Dicrocoelium dendriticum]|nr:unnamed protein product [Dicrocoelium dendriticum]